MQEMKAIPSNIEASPTQYENQKYKYILSIAVSCG